MPDQPISINGTVDQAGFNISTSMRLHFGWFPSPVQVVSAVSGVNSVLQAGSWKSDGYTDTANSEDWICFFNWWGYDGQEQVERDGLPQGWVNSSSSNNFHGIAGPCDFGCPCDSGPCDSCCTHTQLWWLWEWHQWHIPDVKRRHEWLQWLASCTDSKPFPWPVFNRRHRKHRWPCHVCCWGRVNGLLGLLSIRQGWGTVRRPSCQPCRFGDRGRLGILYHGLLGIRTKASIVL